MKVVSDGTRSTQLALSWAIGLVVGINMMFGGSALIAMALHAREIDPRSATVS